MKIIDPCPHDVSEQDVAAQADGLCPLCLHEQVKVMRSALEEIVQKGSKTGYGRSAIAGIAKRALNTALLKNET